MMRLLLSLLLLVIAAPARADVEVSFWSRERGVELPHAFFNAKGTVGGRPVEGSWGFTAKTIAPAILFGPVKGGIDRTPRSYQAKSQVHFSVRVNEATYARLMGLLRQYDTPPGSTYRVNTRNCVHFVADAARIVGLRVPDEPKLMKRPRAFLDAVVAANRGFPTMRVFG